MPHPRILIADDNTWVVRSLQRLIVSLGGLADAEIVTVHDGQDAIDRCAAEAFDWVIVDLSMPRANGLDVLQALHSADHPAQRVLMTGQREPWIAQRAKDLGAVATLFKPLDPTALGEILAPGAESDDPEDTMWPPDLLGNS